ncbi:MAG: YfhO family protein [bacterium]|nr:YfhO family protein [bacterium]
MKYRKDLFYLSLLLGLGVIFWGQALVPDRLFFLRDLSIEILARKHFWAESNGFALWNPFILFGTPYATPQSGAFYPFNFLFSVFGAERGLVYYIIFHHLFFLLTFYLALRRVGYQEETSLLGSIGFGFGGYLISITLLVVLLSTFAWLGLIIIFLSEAQGRRWLLSSLLLGLTIALQILGGEVEIAGMSWALAFLTVILAPARKQRPVALTRLLWVMLLGLFWGIILALPQIAVALEMLPISNRSGGLSFSEVLTWSLPFSSLKSLFIPNFILDLSAGRYWNLGYFAGNSYFSSFYLAAALLPLVFFGFAGPAKWKRYFWAVAALFGLIMMMGDKSGVYEIFYNYLPGFKMFRIPQKFFLFLNFAFVLLALSGFEFLSEQKRSLPLASLACFSAGAGIAVLLWVYPLKIQDLGDNYPAISAYLFWRSVLRSSIFVLIVLGLVFSQVKIHRNIFGLLLSVTVFLDLFAAHHRVNPSVTKDYFYPNPSVRNFLLKENNRITPPRVFSFWPQNKYVNLNTQIAPEIIDQQSRDSALARSAIYFGINSLQGLGTFYPEDVDKYKKLLAELPHYEQLLARAGVEYLYDRHRGMKKYPGALPRAMIFHQVQTLTGQDQVISLWSQPDFPADRILLLEPGSEKTVPVSGPAQPGTARIIEYRNEKVTVDAETEKAGWLLLLDSYYPGWEAKVDGKPVEIFRADGFFRAVRIPAGRHGVVFHYSPAVFRNSVWMSGVGLLAWIGLAVFACQRSRKREETTPLGSAGNRLDVSNFSG